ncbi:ATP-binding protein [Rhodobacterales bacterium HKCCSP123]|nr:ATP-binding protein [Rhodobacterales bacterium HKCCSP123]
MSAPGIGDRPRRVISLGFPAEQGEVRRALISVDAALAAAGVGRDLRDRTQIALAEACNNIVEHAYATGPAASDPAITLDVAADRGGLQITLRDRGGPMPGGRVPVPDLPEIDPDDMLGLPEGGFGWPLLRGMARSLSVSRRNGQNILRFRLPMADTPANRGQKAL